VVSSVVGCEPHSVSHGEKDLILILVFIPTLLCSRVFCAVKESLLVLPEMPTRFGLCLLVVGLILY
jgi:hypothetical protein